MTTQHTPGPWSLSSGWRPTVCVVDTQNVYGAPPNGVVAHVVMASQDGIYSEEKKANARLIAAAPEMKAALEATMAALGCDGDSCDSNGDGVCPKCQAWALARAALASLEGTPAPEEDARG